MGLDAGIPTFAMLSVGGSLQCRPRQAVRSAIRRKQRAVDCSKRGTKSRGEKNVMLARAHEWMAETGRQELATKICWWAREISSITAAPDSPYDRELLRQVSRSSGGASEQLDFRL